MRGDRLLLNNLPMETMTFEYSSLAMLEASIATVADAIRSGRTVIVKKLRTNGYAIFNIERWDVTNRVPYVAAMESQFLPDSWRKTLAQVIDTSHE